MEAFKENIQTVLNQEMDRKKFLAFTGTVVLGAIGVTGFLNILLKSHNFSSSSKDSQASLPTSSAYGSK